MSKANPFSLLGEDGGDEPNVAVPAPKAAVPAPVAKPTPAPAPAKPAAGRGAGGRGRGGFAPREVEGEVVGTEGRGAGRGRGEGRGEGRGGRGGRGPRDAADGESRPRRKDFDRHAQNGRGHEGVKKDGAGRGNWGKEVENPEAVVPKEKVEGEVEPEVPEAVVEEKEPEPDNEMTLEQFEKLQAEKRKALLASITPVAAAAPRDVTAEFAAKKPISKLDAEEEFKSLSLKPKEAAAKAAKDKEAGAPKSPRAVVIKDTGFRVISDESARNNDSGGRGRGGRDGGRGGRDGGRGRGDGGRGRGDGGRGRAPFSPKTGYSAPRTSGGPAFSMEENAFPTLGGK